MFGEAVDSNAFRVCSVEKAGPVKVDRKVVFTGCRSTSCQVIDCLNVPVACVLKAQETGRRVVLVGFLDTEMHCFGSKGPSFVDFKDPRNCSTECCRSSSLVQEHVGVAAEQVLVASAAMAEHRCQIGLRARGKVEPGLLSSHFG